MIDLRSDTVSQPTPAMREAMMAAPLGTDVLGDDPSVNALQAKAAALMGMEDSLYVPSGTMGNQIAIACWTEPGDAILVEEDGHILYYEVGGPAMIASVVSFTIPTERGILDPDDVAKRVKKETIHTPGTKLLGLENTHNRGGGTCIPTEHLPAYRAIADRSGMRIHMDGARIFNAAVAQGVEVGSLTKHVDSINFCLSKGLGCPIGSVLCGPKEFIERARRWRKRLGGGMCQAGLLAAAGTYALDHHIVRLADDHRRAKVLADGLRDLPGLSVHENDPETNIVLIDCIAPAEAWQATMAERGVSFFPFGEHRFRLVTHLGIDDTMVTQAIEAFAGANVASSIRA